MGDDMVPARFPIVQADHLVADRAFGVDRVKPAPTHELDKFDDPYR